MFCPDCWQEVNALAPVCETCGATLAGDKRSYTEKLIAALRHPEALTRRRAAFILGRRRDQAAVIALTALLDAPGDDPYVRAEAACALAAIGGPEAMEALVRAASNPAASVIVRRVATASLKRNQAHG